MFTGASNWEIAFTWILPGNMIFGPRHINQSDLEKFLCSVIITIVTTSTEMVSVVVR